MNYLHQRKNGIYYCRFIVPTALQSRVGRKEVWKSLHTSSKAEAKTLLVMAIMAMTKDMDNDWQHMFGKGKNIQHNEPIELTEKNIPELVEYYYTNQMKGDELSRMWAFGHQAHSVVDTLAEAEKGRLEEIQKALKYGDYKAGEAVTADLIGLLNLKVETGSHLYKALCMSLLQAEWKHLAEVKKRNEGNWEGGTYSGRTTSYESLFNKKAEQYEKKPEAVALTLKTLIDDYNNSPVVARDQANGRKLLTMR